MARVVFLAFGQSNKRLKSISIYTKTYIRGSKTIPGLKILMSLNPQQSHYTSSSKTVQVVYFVLPQGLILNRCLLHLLTIPNIKMEFM